MTVTASSYRALSLNYGIAMLAASTTFQTLVNPTASLAALDRIIENHGGTPEMLAGGVAVGAGNAIAASGAKFAFAGVAYAIARQPQFEPREIALNQYGYSGTIRIQVFIPHTSGDSPPEILRRAENIVGTIATEIEAQFGTAGKLARGRVNPVDSAVADETAARDNTTIGTLEIFWSSP